MKILIINSVCGTGSTGRICTDIADKLISEGHEVRLAYGRNKAPLKYQKTALRIGNDFDLKIHALSTRIFDNHGFCSKKATKKFLKQADIYNPDLLWLHNIHGYYINAEMLFAWIKSRPEMQVKWTLHDCWAFTGHCPYFSFAGCDKWKTGCGSCMQQKTYPKSYIKDNSEKNYMRKKAAFCGVTNMTIITPSKWLCDLVKQSFLSDYPVEVRRNSVNTEIFRPTPGDFRERYGLYNKNIVLGVANLWDKRKGLNDFFKLSKRLGEEYTVVLVGLNDKQLKELPSNVIGIKRTKDAKELAGIYTAADVFLNTTYEDNYPTVNIEAQCCGTPVITYKTGGSTESVPRANVVAQGDIESVVKLLEAGNLEIKYEF